MKGNENYFDARGKSSEDRKRLEENEKKKLTMRWIYQDEKEWDTWASLKRIRKRTVTLKVHLQEKSYRWRQRGDRQGAL